MSGPDGREGPEGVAPLPAQGYATLTFEAPAERPGIGAAAPDRTPPGGWHLPWDRLGTAEAARVLGQLRAGQYEFHTSGVTGEPVRRVLSGELLAADAAHAARLLAPYAPGAVVSFVPPRHAFGASATMMLPALTGLPVWFWPADDCPPPPVAARRIAVVAIPRTFRALARHPRWTASFEHLVLLHGSAELPPEARRFRDDPRIDLIELLGSTETGAVAHRSGWDPQGAWTLLDDVAFAAPAVGAEGPLTVTGPRLAALPDGGRPAHHEMDDLVHRLGDRLFLRRGRRAHLLKANGIRHDLGAIAARLAAALPGADVACVRTPGPRGGEAYDILVAGGGPLTAEGVRAAARGLGAEPRRVHLVDHIPRGPLGKPLAVPPQPPA
ncbi:acyl-CoA synthetase (AMP-forming)/AMP-acid ligase II [Streptomyces sp. 3211.6]|uniref:AMP-binding protein n=1 Tax=Streptomyces TaxID=1883 RepID=UPI0009A52883|nr:MULTISPECIES: AMP-binding protein [Streptomyces]RKT07603.1 acyl-CoA synthetase (AMP-forming)/AMP-acid ligase II [Streptomyces sp. 3211.6]RPF44776.1 acyl-CoA synthetase (AMP-forming)/AMP-acid ligase II [Streptomyces sp. Ag109_G2-6]